MHKVTYKTLKIGDIRRDGDEFRRSGINDETRTAMHQAAMENAGLEEKFQKPQSIFYGYTWEKTNLIGLPILQSDAMHLEHRRP